MIESQRQCTLEKAASLTGTALHTGDPVTLTLQPAPVDHGIRFRRMDLPDQPTIIPTVEKVQMVERATTIIDGGIKVHTVEHVLSALWGMGVDNAIVEMNANEPPIGDGSALPYVECIQSAGIVEQDSERRTLRLTENLHQELPNGSITTIVPDTKLRISCTQAAADGRFAQYLSLEITPEIYAKEIAPARTFVFYEEVKPLLDKGLIRGGSLENAIVIRDETTLSKEPLRFEDEFVRHKILDIIGDYALTGQRFTGHVIAIKPGHGPNNKAARELSKRFARSRRVLDPDSFPALTKPTLDIRDVMDILPHRFPFLMVDQVADFPDENTCIGLKAITINEPYFQGHFPDHPVMPGVLQVEAMAQVASILMLRKSENVGKIGYFMSADRIRFRRPVMPGDMLVIEARILKERRNVGSAGCRCLVNGEVVSEGDLKFNLIER